MMNSFLWSRSLPHRHFAISTINMQYAAAVRFNNHVTAACVKQPFLRQNILIGGKLSIIPSGLLDAGIVPNLHHSSSIDRSFSTITLGSSWDTNGTTGQCSRLHWGVGGGGEGLHKKIGLQNVPKGDTRTSRGQVIQANNMLWERCMQLRSKGGKCSIYVCRTRAANVKSLCRCMHNYESDSQKAQIRLRAYYKIINCKTFLVQL